MSGTFLPNSRPQQLPRRRASFLPPGTPLAQGAPRPQAAPLQPAAFGMRPRSRPATVPDWRVEQPAAYQASEPLLVAAPEVLTWTAKAWALVKACFIGIFCSFAFLSLVAGTGAGEGILGRFKFNAGAIMLLPPLTAILLLPIGIAKVFYRNLLGLPRGWADVFTGGSVGGLVTVAIAMEPSIKSSLMPLCFLFGGIMGGLTFWRAQGFPEVTPGTARIIDRVYGLLRRVRDPRRGMGV